MFHGGGGCELSVNGLGRRFVIGASKAVRHGSGRLSTVLLGVVHVKTGGSGVLTTCETRGGYCGVYGGRAGEISCHRCMRKLRLSGFPSRFGGTRLKHSCIGRC